ncbi:MAG: response regulator [Bacteriovoracaceae bacterium]|jgi:CheY-like chemotaxis protein|nr:response regulator [Bacteriovoracaceae bacterium]
MNVLIIEDEILIQKSLLKIIGAKGHSCIGTSLGKESIELIMNNEFDLIICDLMLRDTTGFDIIEATKVKLSPAEISQKFTIITAYCSEQVLERARGYGCRVFEKPFVDLMKTIDTMLYPNKIVEKKYEFEEKSTNCSQA